MSSLNFSLQQDVLALPRPCNVALREDALTLLRSLPDSHHLRVKDVLHPVDLIAWDSLRMGMGNGRDGGAITCWSHRSRPAAQRELGAITALRIDGLRRPIATSIRTQSRKA